MLELLKEQLIEYKDKFDKNQADCIALMKEGKPWQELAKEGAGLKMMIEATILEMQRYTS